MTTHGFDPRTLCASASRDVKHTLFQLSYAAVDPHKILLCWAGDGQRLVTQLPRARHTAAQGLAVLGELLVGQESQVANPPPSPRAAVERDKRRTRRREEGAEEIIERHVENAASEITIAARRSISEPSSPSTYRASGATQQCAASEAERS